MCIYNIYNTAYIITYICVIIITCMQYICANIHIYLHTGIFDTCSILVFNIQIYYTYNVFVI